MEGILTQLEYQAVWEEFLAHRLMKGRFTWPLFKYADAFVAEEQYLPTVRAFLSQEKPGIPECIRLNKMGTGKKRIVYCYPPDETRILKLISHLLYRYDNHFAPNCYSFRRGMKASDAIFSLRKILREKRMWAYKTDIHDYFNSISIPILLPILKELLSDDPTLFSFFKRMLTDARTLVDGEIIHRQKGVMAGTPTAPFLADVYLMEVDRYFADAGILYARYSDDIILFAPDYETLMSYKTTLLNYLSNYQLEINPTKERIYTPDEPFDFLGFKCLDRSIDISEATKQKMKGKIRRAAHSIARWQHRKGLDTPRAMKGLINTFNNKFFEDDDPEALTWSRWFFPVINKTDGLKEIDAYLQQYIRFLSTGHHTKKNYRVRYADLKALGYRSLVHEYYKYLEHSSKRLP